MAILVDRDTRLVVSGITGREGTFHSLRNRDYGTNVVAGVTPGKGGQDVDGIPVFNTFHAAVQETQANTAMVFNAIVLLTLIGIALYGVVTMIEARVLHYIPRAMR